MKYGLIGARLGHSYSKVIHEQLTSETYELKELQADELTNFFHKKSFRGINVTIPYKETVLSYLDEIDPAAKQIGAVNTIVNQDGKLIGYNTDYLGFAYMLDHHGIDVKDKKVLIFGSGGTSKMVQQVMQDRLASKVLIVSRQASSNTITYEDITEHKDAEILINTTPVGMYPNSDDSPVDVSMFHSSIAVDVIYNPHRTRFLQQARSLGMKGIGGIEMLVAQAVYASQYFHQTTYDKFVIDRIVKQLLLNKLNIVLIGMPGSGKSTVGQLLSEQYQKNFIDTDERIVQLASKEIKDIFADDGEVVFRQIESDVINDAAHQSNSVIASGGGVIKKEMNMLRLQQNGIVLYLHRDIDKLHIGIDRPLSQSLHDNKMLFEQREHLYRKYCDIVIDNNDAPEQAIERIKEALHEITCY